MNYEIDIDLGQFSADWECIAIRVATQKDAFITSGGVVSEPCQAGSFRTIYDEPRIIVRRRWKWPEWLTVEWIAMNEQGVWRGCEYEPQEGPHDWFECGRIVVLWDEFTNFTPPPCTDWKQSKRRNPRSK